MTHRGPFQPLLFCDSVKPCCWPNKKNQGIKVDLGSWVQGLLALGSSVEALQAVLAARGWACSSCWMYWGVWRIMGCQQCRLLPCCLGLPGAGLALKQWRPRLLGCLEHEFRTKIRSRVRIQAVACNGGGKIRLRCGRSHFLSSTWALSFKPWQMNCIFFWRHLPVLVTWPGSSSRAGRCSSVCLGLGRKTQRPFPP